MKWYVVPNYTHPDNTVPVSLRPATVVDQYGQQVAEFEALADAEAAVAHFNSRHDGLVTLPVREAS